MSDQDNLQKRDPGSGSKLGQLFPKQDTIENQIASNPGHFNLDSHLQQLNDNGGGGGEHRDRE